MATAKQNAETIIAQVLALPQAPGRRLVALAGPPAAGKSTVAEMVQRGLTDRGLPTGLLPMDGFHMDNSALDDLGLRSRKGAPETFDLQGLQKTLQQLSVQPEVPVPTFDRIQDRTVPNAQIIGDEQAHVVVEGNYLLLDEEGWRDLSKFWDFSVLFQVPLKKLEARLVARWTELGHPEAEALVRARTNDIPNARRVMHARMPSSLVLGAA
ncbi:MAG: nucleoside/nucleotide kinase family protein [Pseudomonadota bacterium]